ncbi:MAG: BRCT domain-containing protein [Balneolaceae bacterium]|nr:BRCT domain-containing protein [Balneolaceae bacterium]
MEADEETVADIDSIGPKIAESVVRFFNNEKNKRIIEKLRNHGLTFTAEKVQRQSRRLEDKKFVLTGSLATLTRKEATELIEKHGGRTTSSVSGNTDFLLAGESPGRKYDKAEELGIPIISEDDLRIMID